MVIILKWKDWDLNLKIRLLGEGVINILFWMYFPFMSIYFAESFGKVTAGMLLIVSQLFGVFANLLGGYLADHIGRKKMMVSSYVGAGSAFVLFAFANSPWYNSPILTFVAFSLLGIFSMLYWPASHAMVADVVPEQHRNAVFAVFYTAINITVVIGPLLGSLFFFQYRFELLLTGMMISFVFAFILWKYIRETAPKKHVISQQRGGKRPWYEYVKDQVSSYRIITTDKVFLLFIIAGILVAQTFMQLDLLIAVYVSEMVPDQTLFSYTITGEKLFGILISENGLLVALFTVVMTRWMSRYKEKSVFIGSAVTYGIGMILFAHSMNMFFLMFAMLIFTIGELMVVGVQQGFVSKLAPEDMRGQYFAASDLRFTIGRTIAPIAIPLTTMIGFTFTFYSIAFLAFVSAIIYWRMFYLVDRQPVKQKAVVQQ